MVVFSGADACMDVTESCTGSIATDFAAAHNVMAQSCDIKKVRQTLGQQHSLALRLSCYQGMLLLERVKYDFFIHFFSTS